MQVGPTDKQDACFFFIRTLSIQKHGLELEFALLQLPINDLKTRNPLP